MTHQLLAKAVWLRAKVVAALVAVIVAVMGITAASSAFAATGNTFHSVHKAGYSVVGGHIRYAAEVVTPRAALNPDGSGVSYQVGLLGKGHQANVFLKYTPDGFVASGGGGTPVTLDLVNKMASNQGSDPVFYPVKLYVYYDQKTHTATTSVRDMNDNVLYKASFKDKDGINFYSARFWESFPGAYLSTETAPVGVSEEGANVPGTWEQPAKAKALDAFAMVHVTSYNGTHGGLIGIPWTNLHPWNLESQVSGVSLVSPALGTANEYELSATGSS